jgi:hypothetical protein
MATIDQFMTQYNAPKQSGIDSFMSQYEKKKPIEPSIYSKGGIYEQFGEQAPAFNPMPKKFGGIIEAAADQPGSALPFVGQAAGGFAGPVGGVGGALAGEAVRQGMGRLFGVQKGADSMRQFKQAGKNAALGELFGYGTGKAIEAGAQAVAPFAQKAAIRIAKNIIRPTGKLAKRSDILAKTALEEGLLSSNPQSMVKKVKAKGSQLQGEIDGLIDNFQGGKLNYESALKRMDALARKYRSLGAFDDADKVLKVKNQIIEGGNLRQPVMGVTSEVDELGIPKEKITKIGEKPREVTASQMNKRKREEYRYLEGKRQNGGWMSDTSTPEIVARQEFAGGTRREIARNIPEVDPLNRRFGNIIDLGKAVEGRANVGTRNDIMSLGDIVLASNPKTVPLMFARKAWQGARGFGAKSLYGLERFGKNVGKTLKSPATRAMISNAINSNEN